MDDEDEVAVEAVDDDDTAACDADFFGILMDCCLLTGGVVARYSKGSGFQQILCHA